MQGTAPTFTGEITTEPFPSAGLEEHRERECLALLGRLQEMEIVAPARHYEAGQSIFLEGEPGDGLYVLTDGIARICKSYSGTKEVALRLVGSWEVFGDLAPVAQLVQGATARAFTECEVIKVPKVFIERATKADREVAYRLLTILGLELAYQKELVGCLLPRTTDARLAVLLPLLARRFGEEAGGAVVLPRLTHMDLASMVAMTRESVTAALRSLRRRGLIRAECQIISILKPAELAEMGRQDFHDLEQGS
ncbi:MAG: Crp/Fnr family transcriptional regulator [Rubrobacteraceae bacterium]